MHAVGYRPRLSYVALALATLFVLGVLATERRSERGCPARHAKQTCARTLEESRGVADLLYRSREFHGAERVLRAAGTCAPDLRTREELHVIATFYHSLAHSVAFGDSLVPVTDTVQQLDWAIQLDAMLGGAHADALIRRKRDLLHATGPE